MHFIYLFFIPHVIGVNVETALFEVPVNSISKDIKTLQQKIKNQKDKCINPPSFEWCEKDAVRHEGWHSESDFGIAICDSTIWTRENHFNGLHLVEQELEVIALTFENCLITLGIDIEEFSKVEKDLQEDMKRIPTFRTINHPKLVDDNGFEIAKSEIIDIFSSGEKMIEDFEKGNYADVVFTFFKQLKQTITILFKKRDGETKIDPSGDIAWLYGNTMLNVSTLKYYLVTYFHFKIIR